jgi:hypothetical protein
MTDSDPYDQYLLEELRSLKNNINERNQRLYLANSILFSASILVILGCFQYRELLHFGVFVPIGAVLLLTIMIMLVLLLFLHLTARKVTDVDFKAVDRIIEHFTTSGKVSPMKETFERELKGKWWFEMRKWLWSMVTILLIILDIIALVIFLLGT